MLPITPQECSRIAQDLQIRKVQVESVVQLLDEGNTVPFITRYRKERTGGLHEELIRQIQTRVAFLRSLHDRKQTILKTIANQGKLTDELRQAIAAADTTKRLEDLYLPYKPKKRSLASTARERGLEPLAHAIWYSDPAAANLDELLPALVNPEKELKSVDDVRTGVGHILAEMMAESAEVRAPVRAVLWETGNIQSTKNEKLPEGQGNEFKNYFQFKESVRQIPPHRILALNRGEKEHAVKVSFEWIREPINEVSLRGLADLLLKRAGQMPPPPAPTPAARRIGACRPSLRRKPRCRRRRRRPSRRRRKRPGDRSSAARRPNPPPVVVAEAPPLPPVVEAPVPAPEQAAARRVRGRGGRAAGRVDVDGRAGGPDGRALVAGVGFQVAAHRVPEGGARGRSQSPASAEPRTRDPQRADRRGRAPRRPGLRAQSPQPAAAAAPARQTGPRDRPRLPHRLQGRGSRRIRQPARALGHLSVLAAVEEEGTPTRSRR